MKLMASEHIGNGFPPEEGIKFAGTLLSRDDVDWGDLEVDLQALPAGMLISAFFNGFLQHVYEQREQLLEAARKIRWDVKFDFQRENIALWMKNFKPFQPAAKA